MEHVVVPASARPGAAVLAAFGLEGDPVPLNGGQGRSWLVGQAVLKPLDLPLPALRWHAELPTRLDGLEDLRVSMPLRATDQWASSGWTAWRYQPGVHLPGRWHDIVEVGRLLHAALRDEPEPAFLADRDDIRAIADRVAWAEQPADDHAGTKHLDKLIEGLRPVPGAAQLIHGALTGNVLFHPGLPPLVIDLSPYWRPPAFASAVVIADALVFEGAHPQVVQPMLADPAFPRYLLRALIFRAVTDHLARPHLRRPDSTTRTSQPWTWRYTWLSHPGQPIHCGRWRPAHGRLRRRCRVDGSQRRDTRNSEPYFHGSRSPVRRHGTARGWQDDAGPVLGRAPHRAATESGRLLGQPC